MTPMTPLAIDIALHYWTRPTDYGGEDNNHHASAVRETIQRFLDAGLLHQQTDDGVVLIYDSNLKSRYAGTEALEVYVNALYAVPLPVQRWVMPE